MTEQEPEKPSADDIQSIVSQLAQDARAFIEEDINPKRVDAIDYYNGRPFGNEEDGRSKVVSTDVRDGIQAMLPGLLRTFCGSERALEARPRSAEDEAKAEEQTAFANLVYFNDNNGFRITHDRLLNGLREGFGCAKVWWDDTPHVSAIKHTGLSAEDLVGLADDPQVSLSDVTENENGTAEEPLYDATVTRVEPDGRIRVEAVPPEEIIVNATARNEDDALIFGHCTEKMVSDVIKMGYTQEQIEDAIGESSMDSTVEQARNPADDGVGDDGVVQFALRPILYSELWVYLDLEGAGRADLYKVCTVGDNFKVLHIEPANERPFACFVPLPEPHTIFGQSWADLLMDTQKVKSAIRRGMLDSLALTLNPRTVILDGAVEIDDVLNTEVGGLIRERVANAVRTQEHRFVGADAMVMVQYEDENAEQRTGRSKAAQGLNADSLQSATKMAVSATVSAAHQRAELLAYIFAESQRKLFKLILKIARRHQQRARIIRLRGGYVPVDPGNWDTELDFEVTVGLGSGMVEERKAVLTEILAAQQAALESLGPTNPLTSLGRMRNTLAKLTHLGGYPDEDQFWKQVDDEAIDRASAEAEKDPKNKMTDADKLAEAQKELQAMKSQTDLQLAQMEQGNKSAEIALKREELALKRIDSERSAELEKQKMLLEFELKKAELEAKYAADLEMQRIKAEFEQQKLIAETAAKREQAQIQAESARYAADKQAEAKVTTGTKKKISLTRDPASGRPTGATVETSGGE